MAQRVTYGLLRLLQYKYGVKPELGVYGLNQQCPRIFLFAVVTEGPCCMIDGQYASNFPSFTPLSLKS